MPITSTLIEIDQGDDWAQGYGITIPAGIGLQTDCYFEMEIRNLPKDQPGSNVIATPVMTIDQWDIGNKYIHLTSNLSSADTSAMPTTGQQFDEYENFVYDIYMIRSNMRKRILNGTCFVSPQVTEVVR